ncbi:MAG: recombinase family protein [Candidatus Buchananbacteria bacterium]
MNKATITKKRAAIYLRTANDDQQGSGIAEQEVQLRAFVASNDYLVDKKHVYKDSGVSGLLPLEKRSGAKKLFEGAERHEFDLIIVKGVDRISRGYHHFFEMLDKFSRLKVGIKAVDGSIDTLTTSGKARAGLLTTMMTAMARFENDALRERLMRGKLAAKERRPMNK